VIEVEYGERPALLDIRAGARPDSPPIHQWDPTRLSPHFGPLITIGGCARGTAIVVDEADVIVEGRVSPAGSKHCPSRIRRLHSGGPGGGRPPHDLLMARGRCTSPWRRAAHTGVAAHSEVRWVKRSAAVRGKVRHCY